VSWEEKLSRELAAFQRMTYVARMTNKFKVGDVVTLKSGGPKMTVSHVNVAPAGTRVECKWANGEKIEIGKFNQDVLKCDEAGKNELDTSGDD
jgi:uncharacterized protein YodC (DUF2158 family)